jgi:hypothetical protein
LKEAALNGKAFHMNEGSAKNLSREERLAAKLRENLRRRKAQGKAQSRALGDSAQTEALPNPPAEG